VSSPAAAAEPAETQLTELPALDPVIHAQPRLRVVVALTALGRDDRITFPRLQELLSMTAGNLSTHLRKLEEASYVTITKTYRRRTPVTYVALSGTGRRAFEDYTNALRALLEFSDHPAEETY
jgi:DNA-binding MarR family transcriptional regulator